MFDLIAYAKGHKLGHHCYVLRAKILEKFYEVKEHNDIPDAYIMCCNDNVGKVLENIVEELNFSYTERRVCSSDVCPDVFKSYESYQVPLNQFNNLGIDEIIGQYKYLVKKNAPCKQIGCKGTTETHQILGE